MTGAPPTHTHRQRPPLRALFACALVCILFAMTTILSCVGVYALVRGIR